jgi:hypothetical protein
VDLGCGDFNVGSQLRPYCSEYVACDIVQSLIERNKLKFADRGVEFRALDMASDPLPAGDVVFIRQVLQHMSNAQILALLPLGSTRGRSEHTRQRRRLRPTSTSPRLGIRVPHGSGCVEARRRSTHGEVRARDLRGELADRDDPTVAYQPD